MQGLAHRLRLPALVEGVGPFDPQLRGHGLHDADALAERAVARGIRHDLDLPSPVLSPHLHGALADAEVGGPRQGDELSAQGAQTDQPTGVRRTTSVSIRIT